MSAVQFPKSLSTGDKIAIISPAGKVTPIQLEKGLERIQSMGYEPILGKHLYTEYQHGYPYAGTEKQRIEDINWALNDPEISAIWTSRGGYGCQHLLDYLDLQDFKNEPKWYIGYSDNTAVQSYLLQQGFASIHAQTIKTSNFGVSDDGYSLTFDLLSGKIEDFSLENHPLNKFGTANGQLVGGNLALVYALLGTPYSFNFEDKILFIEEIGEKFYALDRMLMALEHAGVFKKIKGLIIGGMTLMDDERENPAYEHAFDEFAFQLISERIAQYNFPTLFAFPNGHIYENLPLIIGANVELIVEDRPTLKYLL